MRRWSEKGEGRATGKGNMSCHLFAGCGQPSDQARGSHCFPLTRLDHRRSTRALRTNLILRPAHPTAALLARELLAVPGRRAQLAELLRLDAELLRRLAARC